MTKWLGYSDTRIDRHPRTHETIVVIATDRWSLISDWRLSNKNGFATCSFWRELETDGGSSFVVIEIKIAVQSRQGAENKLNEKLERRSRAPGDLDKNSPGAHADYIFKKRRDFRGDFSQTLAKIFLSQLFLGKQNESREILQSPHRETGVRDRRVLPHFLEFWFDSRSELKLKRRSVDKKLRAEMRRKCKISKVEYLL